MKDSLEEAAEKYGWRIKTNSFSDKVKANELAESSKQDFINGAKWQQERSYSEEEVLDILLLSYSSISDRSLAGADLRNWFKQFNKK